MNKEDITIKLDGNMWCAHRSDFTNLQESVAAFGDNPVEALINLLKEETPQSNCSCHISPPCSDCVDNGAVREIIKNYT